MKNEYRVRADIVHDEEEQAHTVYGIDLLVDGKVTRSVPDVFFEAKKADEFVHLCNTLELSPLHLDDVVEDALLT